MIILLIKKHYIKIKFRCNCDESGDLQDYKHQNLKLSFDFNNYKITQYVNNNPIYIF